MSVLHESLSTFFDEQERRQEAEHPIKHLHYGSDLAPSACERAAWFRLRGAKRRSLTLGEHLLFAAGHRVEGLLLDAVEAAGRLVARQGVVRPMRPSAWAWSGRFDAIVRDDPERETLGSPDMTDHTPGGLVLVDVKTARSAAFKRRDGLVKETHLWQLAAYFHEVRKIRPDLVRAELWYADRDGSNQPTVVPVTAENGLLVPEEKVIAEETRKAVLALSQTPCPPLRPEMTRERYPCSYCAFLDVSCRPDAERAAEGGEKPSVSAERSRASRPRTPRKTLPPKDTAGTVRVNSDAGDGGHPATDAPPAPGVAPPVRASGDLPAAGTGESEPSQPGGCLGPAVPW